MIKGLGRSNTAVWSRCNVQRVPLGTVCRGTRSFPAVVLPATVPEHTTQVHQSSSLIEWTERSATRNGG